MISEAAIDSVINDVLRREGGYVNRVEDRGGPTNFGVTIYSLHKWRGVDVTADDVRNMTQEEARAIYRTEYVARPGFELLPGRDLLDAVVDVAVNMSVHRAVTFVQRALGLTADGISGPATRAAMRRIGDNTYAMRDVFKRVVAERVVYIGRIVSGDRRDADRDGISDNAEFAAGWLARSAEFIRKIP